MTANSILRPIVILTCAALLGACSTVRYYQDYEPSTPFDRYDSYVFSEDIEDSQSDQRGLSALDADRVIDGLVSALARAGLQRTDSFDADLIVDFRFTSETRLDIDTFGPAFTTGYSYGSPYGPGYGFYGGQQLSVDQRTEGTLVVDLIDKQTGELLWRGWAVRAIDGFDNKQPEERRAAFEELTSGILERYPPERRR
ncbi:MAG: DUF4136 domain-containing protein [Planctomycetota bacterium]